MVPVATIPKRPFAEADFEAAKSASAGGAHEQCISFCGLDENDDSILHWRHVELQRRLQSLPSPCLEDLKYVLQVLAILSIPLLLVLTCYLCSGHNPLF
jgi:hypothetical protein